MAVELAMRTNSLRSGFVHFFTRCSESLMNSLVGTTTVELKSPMLGGGG